MTTADLQQAIDEVLLAEECGDRKAPMRRGAVTRDLRLYRNGVGLAPHARFITILESLGYRVIRTASPHQVTVRRCTGVLP